MGEYSKFISETRRAVPTPKSLVDENGRCVFGTFQSEFEDMDLVRAERPTKAPQHANRIRLTLWQATEINLKNGVLLAAISDMGIFGKTFCVFYDKRTKKVYCWDHNLKSRDTVIAPNLIRGSVAEARTNKSSMKYVNELDKGRCRLTGRHENETDSIEYDFSLQRISLPCVVSIPFGENRPLYSQKDLLRATGKLVINGEEMLSDEDTAAIVDDHRGYYPRRAHYDWVTTMGRNAHNGENRFFGFNLTRNQSIDQDRYNENLIWFEGSTSLLTPVTFTRTVESADFAGSSDWHVKDEHGMVDLTFHVDGMNAMVVHAGVVNIDYYITFGTLSGFVLDENGEKYLLDGMTGIGEDKTLLL